MKSWLLAFSILVGFTSTSPALLCRQTLDSSSSTVINSPQKAPVEIQKHSDLTQAIYHEHLRLHQAYQEWTTASTDLAAKKKVMDNQKMRLTWKDLFLVRHVLFRSRTESKEYRKAKSEYREVLKLEKKTAKELATLKDENQKDSHGIDLKNSEVRKYLSNLAWDILKDSLILNEGEQVKFLNVFHFTKPEFDPTQAYNPGQLPVQQIQMAVVAHVGNQRFHYMLEFHYSPKNDRILKQGVIEYDVFQNSKERPYDRLLAGRVYEKGLTKIVDHTPLQKFITKKKLSLSQKQIHTIQQRSLQHRAFRNQVNTVVSMANSSRQEPTQDLLHSYMLYWAFDGSPFSLALMPPTHWFLFNMTLGTHGQHSVAHVLEDAATQLNQGKILEQSDLQKRLDSELDNADRSPIVLQTPGTDVQWDSQMNNLTHGLSDEAAARIGTAIEGSVDVESLAKQNEDLGLDPSTTSLVESDSGGSQSYDDSSSYSSPDSYDSSSSSSSSDY